MVPAYGGRTLRQPPPESVSDSLGRNLHRGAQAELLLFVSVGAEGSLLMTTTSD